MTDNRKTDENTNEEQEKKIAHFSDLELHPKLLSAVKKLSYETPTPIQATAIPVLLTGVDVIGGARTGSGKTAAFGLPMLHQIGEEPKGIQGLVLAPTRELALQVTEMLRSFAADMRIRITTIYGGASYDKQLRALRAGVGIVVGTPGRMIDLLDRGALKLGNVRFVVLDEADEMLRMGFIEDVSKILSATPEDRQTALFSATMPQQIRRIAKEHLKTPQTLQVESSALSVGHIEQAWIAVPSRNKLEALVRVLDKEERDATLIFVRTRAGCAEVADLLAKRGVPADALHGDLNQAARERVLSRLRSKRLDIVVATDVAARGIDVKHITHVINFDFPHDSEIYVHRIGRTGRVGRKGLAITFVTAREQRKLRFLQKDIDAKINRFQIPSDAEIIEKKRARLQNKLTTAIEKEDLSSEKTFIKELLESNVDLEAIAAAALKGFSRSIDIDLGQVPSAEPPKWMQPQNNKRERREQERDFDRGQKKYRDLGEEQEICFSVGRQHGVRPGDFVGAIANEANIRGANIGRITVLERKTFVSLPVKIANMILRKYDSMDIRGTHARIKNNNKQSTSQSQEGENIPRANVGESLQGREVFLPIGSKQRVREKDIIRSIIDATKITEDEIGKITVLGGKSFVRLPNKIAASLLASHATISLRGMDVPITPARPRNERSRPIQQPYRRTRKGRSSGFKKR